MTITSILSNTYSIDSIAGQKTTCPFCSHKNFQIHKNNIIGKCFNPACLKYLSIKTNHPLYPISEKIYNDFAEALQKDSQTYLYLLARKITPQTIENNLIGTVPYNYDISKVCKEQLELVNKLPSKTKQQQKTKQESYDIINTFLEKYKTLFLNLSGWLAFFYTDSSGAFTKIKLRKPFEKTFKLIKFTDHDGLFGSFLNTPSENTVIFEGEFNLLRYQSVCHNYLTSFAVGGVSSVDYSTISKSCKNVTFFYDNDENNAGTFLYSNAIISNKILICTTPQKESDLDSFADNGAEQLTIENIINNAAPICKTRPEIAKKIAPMREELTGSSNDYIIMDNIAEIITQNMNDLGKFLITNNNPFYFDSISLNIIPICKDDNQLIILLSQYNLIKTEKIWKYVFEKLKIFTLTDGCNTTLHSISFFKPNTLYLNMFCGKIAKLTSNSFEICNNGCDNVFFLSHNSWTPIDFEKLDPTNLEHSGILDDLIFNTINFDSSDNLARDEQILLFKAWTLSIFFPQLLPTKPLVAFIGQKGSGKSSTGRKLGKMIFGNKFEITGLSDDPKDFESIICNSPFIVIDNADSYKKWLNDALALISTGGSYKRRTLYTTNQISEIPINSFAILTARTPKFTRDDVADRTIVLNLNRLPTFTAEHSIMDSIAEHRTYLWNDLIIHCQYILKIMQSHQPSNKQTTRMADFAKFAELFSSAFGGNLPQTLSNLEKTQLDFSIESDPLVDILTDLAQKDPNKAYSPKELLTAIQSLNEPIFNKYSTSKSILNKIKTNLPAYSSFVNINVKKLACRHYSISLSPLTIVKEEFDY